MRFEGTITGWDSASDAGFIEPHQGGEVLPVRVYDMRFGSQRPMIGEVWTFEVRQAPDGQKRAVHARRLGDTLNAASAQHTGSGAPERPPSVRPPSVWPLRLTVASLLLLFLLAGWTHLQKHQATEPLLYTPPAMATIPLPVAVEAASEPIYRCDGRTHCSQMSSCEEATFFLKSCPGVQMDGNADGVPCEQQWCTGG